MPPKSILERALELAASGHCKTITEIVNALKKEQFEKVNSTFQGRAVRTQLRQIMRSVRRAASPTVNNGSEVQEATL